MALNLLEKSRMEKKNKEKHSIKVDFKSNVPSKIMNLMVWAPLHSPMAPNYKSNGIKATQTLVEK